VRYERSGSGEVLAAIAAITGQSLAELEGAFRAARREQSDQSRATPEEMRALIDRIKTRLGLAPAVDPAHAADLGDALAALVETNVTLTNGDVATWERMLRHTPEQVPSIDREPVVFPILPAHQTQMWQTMIDLDNLECPWVLIGGQMTMLHCLEHGVPLTRATDDGDVVVGVWTRRDALAEATRFLRERGFEEVRTSDGYGYRYQRGEKTVIDVMLPEGLHRQREYPATASGRPGFPADGGNQALARAERLPVTVDDITGYVRRPTILGSIVAKAHAWQTDSRDIERHEQDIVKLAQIGLNDPRSVLQAVRPRDRKAVRIFLRDKSPDDPCFRAVGEEREAVFALLTRLATPGH
jgi:hypothetical protein